jgi:EpsI family protein
MNLKVSRSVLFAAILMAVSLPAAIALKPTHYVADQKPALVLENVLPLSMPGWQQLENFQVAVPDPTVKEVIDATYSQTVTRGYINGQGQVVIMTVAYGRDQNSEETAAHRPEFCYVGAGFQVSDLGPRQLHLEGVALTVRHVLAQRQDHQEKISYWVTLDEKATLPGMGRKLAQIGFGLRGLIADGMLVRVSTPGLADDSALALHTQFLEQLHKQVPTIFKARVFGA